MRNKGNIAFAISCMLLFKLGLIGYGFYNIYLFNPTLAYGLFLIGVGAALRLNVKV